MTTRKLAELPDSKIKKIMRFDPDVDRITSEAVHALKAATETFVTLLARQMHTHAGQRKTLKPADFDSALSTVPWLDFLDGALIGWDDIDARSAAVDAPSITADVVEPVDVDDIADQEEKEGSMGEEEMSTDDSEGDEETLPETMIDNDDIMCES